MKNSDIDTILDQYRLKDRLRTGWTLRAVEQPESVADHSWGTALLCIYFANHELDRERALSIAVVHDLAEAETGDIPRRIAADAQPVTPGEKTARERVVMAGYGMCNGEIERLWREYEAGETPEAQFVRDMNLLDMCIQALFYEVSQRYDEDASSENFPDYAGLDEFFATSGPRFVTSRGRELFTLVQERYRALRSVTRSERRRSR